MASRFGRMLAGLAAGAAGTLAMDLVWYARYRRGGGEDGFLDWEFATSTSSFDEASAPGQAGKKIADTVGVDLPDDAAGVTTNVMHWLTGVGYGLGLGLARNGAGVLRSGVATGVGAFSNSYAAMGALGIYEPIWKYDAQTLAKDLGAHLVYGLTAATVFTALAGDGDEGDAEG